MKKCFTALASPIHDKDIVNSIINELFLKLSKKNKLVNKGLITHRDGVLEGLSECDVIVALVVTGGSEELIIEASMLGKPVIFIAHSSMNSLPALMEAKPLAERINNKIWSIYLDENRPNASLEYLLRIMKGIEVASSLNNYNLGLIGGISSWLVYSRVDPIIVKQKLGINIIDVSLDEIYEKYNKVSENVLAKLLSRVLSNAERVEVSEKRVKDSLKLYLALKYVIKERNLDAITIKCFDIITALDTTACLPLSLLNSEGIVAGCEGDVPSALAMIVLNKLSGKPVFMGNPSKIGDNKVMIAHCTAPMAIGPYVLRTHFETGKGVGIAVKYPKGERVTLLRFSADLSVMRIIRGLIESGEAASNLHCRTQITIRLSTDPLLLLEKSIGNHYALVLGDYAEELKSFARVRGIKTEII